MLHSDFVHLHVHTNYSLLDGACRIPDLIKKAAELKFPALAMTDHGNLFGAIEFYNACMKGGLKPILGVEAYVAPKSRADRTGTGIKDSNAHLVLLARDEAGYYNLLRLVTTSYLDGFYYKPRIDKQVLREHGQGLIALTSCLKGVLNVHLTQEQTALARRELDDYIQILGRENVYVELQNHGLELEDKMRPQLARLAQEMGVKTVATNDVHYLDASYAQAHDVLMAIQMQTTVDDPNRLRYEKPEFYLKSAEQMKQLFAEFPEALRSTIEIADRCNVELDFKKTHMPNFEAPPGKTREAYLLELCQDGLARRYPAITPPLQERLAHELKVIQEAGYTSYFLIVWDFVRFARERGIPVGPGRGSAAGSIVSYCLRITDLDPLQYDLLFERFLNPQRVSLPDIDIDFCYERRPEVIDYVIKKYGQTCVAQIITFGTMQAKAVVRDVGRAMKMPYAEVDRLAKLIPNELDITLKRALAEVPELKELYGANEQVRDLIDTGMRLEGLTRHSSTHAAGVAIADKPLVEYMPLCRSSDGQVTTGFEMSALEKLGLLKMDLLGLRTLTVLKDAVDLIERTRGTRVDLETLPLNDVPTYELLCRAETMGIFQLESSGMRELLRKLRPSEFEDIIAVLALYRPGPIGSGMLDEFIKRKHGQITFQYEHPLLEPILKPTYGVIVYQEQVMRIASDLGGFTLAQADLLRRAMGKKIAEVMESQRKAFVDGCHANANKISDKVATRVFDLMEHFAGYGFNKCVVGETEITDADTGRPVTVESLYRSPRPIKTFSVDEQLRLVKRRVLNVVSNGPKPVFRVTTHLGRTITVTDNHPFLTFDGWKELRDLQAGDFVAVPRKLPLGSTPEPVEPFRLVALAAILAEGNTCHPSGVYVYNNDPLFIEDFVVHVSRFERTVPTVRQRGSLYEVYAGTGQQTTFAAAHTPWNQGQSGYSRSGSHGSHPDMPRSGVRIWIEELGLEWLKSTEKFIPDFVFTLSADQLALFLGRLWSGDGHLWSDTGPPLPTYATSSKRLAFQVQHLLLRLSIIATVKSKAFRYRSGLRTGYVVYISGKEQVGRFLEVIAPHLIGRAEALRRLRAHYDSVRDDRTSKDVIPAQVKSLVRHAKDRLTLAWSDLESRTGLSMKEFYGGIHAYKRGFRRSTIRQLGEFCESPALLRYATSDVYWDRIRSIEPCGTAQTYDLEIEDTHNFVANDLIVHNSHSAAYALISYRTAYLKAHYPVEFMAALLTSEMGNMDKLVAYLDEVRRSGIVVLPPDINESEATFMVVNERSLRCGMGIIKNVGLGAIESIVETRQRSGRFQSIEALCQELDLRLVNRKVLESLIKSGACDSLRCSRAAALARLDQALEEATVRQKDRQRGQMTFLDAMSAADAASTAAAVEAAASHGQVSPPPAVMPEWPESQKLAFEKELLGFYVSGHPLARYSKLLGAITTMHSTKFMQVKEETNVVMGGMISRLKLTTTKKKNEQMAVFVLEDLEGEVEVLVFPSSYTQLAPQLKISSVVVVEGRAGLRDGQPRLIAQQLIPLEQSGSRLIKSIEVVLRSPSLVERSALAELRSLLVRHPGSVPMFLTLQLPEQQAVRLRLAEDFKIDPRPEVLDALEQLLGPDAIQIRRQPLAPSMPPPRGARREAAGARAGGSDEE